jgi:hypothetical protein
MRTVVLCGLAMALLAWNVGHGLRRTAPDLGALPGRYFDDLSMATHLYRGGGFPLASYRVRRAAVRPDGDAAFARYREHLVQQVAAAGVTTATPFATIASPGDADGLYVRRRDDSGRALLLGLCFRLLGGIAPALLFWMAPILAAAVLAWIALELAAAGRALAGEVTILLVASSAYVTDVLGLAYSAAGFYVVGLLALVAYAAFACLSPAVSPRAVLARSLAAGALIAVCALCRSGTLVLVPFFAAAAAVAVRRHEGGTLPRRAAVLAAAGIALAAPFAAASAAREALVARTAAAHAATAEPQDHDVWISIWEGLGDFDRTHGHVWDDEVAQGLTGDWRLGSLRSAEILRGYVVEHVRGDPLWYAGILARRVAATLTQWKILPWTPLGGRAMRPRGAANEGAIDSYYALTSQVDWFRIGRLRFEVPFPLFWLPAAAVLVLGGRSPAARAPALVLGLLVLATLALPVAVTTAGALETQALGIAYFAAAGLAADQWRRRMKE